MTLTEHIALCEQHHALLRFNRFDAAQAWRLGNALYQAAHEKRFALAIEIRVNQTCWFSALMPGATAENVDWVRRKRNMVDLLGTSSWAAGLMLKARQTTLAERYGLETRDYAAFGGSYPIVLESGAAIGTVSVSGAPQLDDHNLVISTLCAHLGLSETVLTLVPELA